jgi:hypothetical protein
VKVLGYYNWPGRIPVAASTLYAKNLLTFLTTFWDKDAKAPKLPPEDEIVKGVMLTRGGAIVHANFEAEAAAPVPVASPAPEAPSVQDVVQKPASSAASAKPKAASKAKAKPAAAAPAPAAPPEPAENSPAPDAHTDTAP